MAHLDPHDLASIDEAKRMDAVFVTWDRVVREATGGITPYQVLEEAEKRAENSNNPEALAEIKRLRALSAEDLTVLRDKANEAVEHLRKHIRIGDVTAALVVRHLRVEEQYSWRAIARHYSEILNAPWGSNQFAGLVICEQAAQLLGEDFMEAPWD